MACRQVLAISHPDSPLSKNPYLHYNPNINALDPFNTEIFPFPLPKTRAKHRTKTVGGALIMCLNIGTDPPDLIKTQPCGMTEAWVDPGSTDKPLDIIGNSLIAQYEFWQPKSKFKAALDPTADDVRKLCSSLRKGFKEERVLFHYNGHGVPKPTINGEIWVFNKQFTQYIPLNIMEIQTILGSGPVIYVFDCSYSGYLLNALIKWRDRKIFGQTLFPSDSNLLSPASGTSYSSTLENSKHSDMPSELKRTDDDSDIIFLGATQFDGALSFPPQMPADIFTSCLTTPIEMAIRWYICFQNPPLHTLTLDQALKIPGRLMDRKSPLGELNWILTALTDCIAWNILPNTEFQKLFRNDVFVASLFRNFLLAERIMKTIGDGNWTGVSLNAKNSFENHRLQPISYPSIPPGYKSKFWDLWDYSLEYTLNQVQELICKKKDYQPSTFFTDQLKSFDVYLFEHAHMFNLSEKTNHQRPDNLPIILQSLLSPSHRLSAFHMLARFFDFGPWAIYESLHAGIMAYLLKMIGPNIPATTGQQEQRAVLIYLWCRLVSCYPEGFEDIFKDELYVYFLRSLVSITDEIEQGTFDYRPPPGLSWDRYYSYFSTLELSSLLCFLTLCAYENDTRKSILFQMNVLDVLSRLLKSLHSDMSKSSQVSLVWLYCLVAELLKVDPHCSSIISKTFMIEMIPLAEIMLASSKCIPELKSSILHVFIFTMKYFPLQPSPEPFSPDFTRPSHIPFVQSNTTPSLSSSSFGSPLCVPEPEKPAEPFTENGMDLEYYISMLLLSLSLLKDGSLLVRRLVSLNIIRFFELLSEIIKANISSLAIQKRIISILSEPSVNLNTSSDSVTRIISLAWKSLLILSSDPSKEVSTISSEAVDLLYTHYCSDKIPDDFQKSQVSSHSMTHIVNRFESSLQISSETGSPDSCKSNRRYSGFVDIMLSFFLTEHTSLTPNTDPFQWKEEIIHANLEKNRKECEHWKSFHFKPKSADHTIKFDSITPISGSFEISRLCTLPMLIQPQIHSLWCAGPHYEDIQKWDLSISPEKSQLLRINPYDASSRLTALYSSTKDRYLTVSSTGSVRLLDILDDSFVQRACFKGISTVDDHPTCSSFIHSTLALGGSGQFLECWDVYTCQRASKISVNSPVISLLFQDNHCLYGGTSGSLFFVDLRTSEPQFIESPSPLTHLSFMDSYLISGHADTTVSLWDNRKGFDQPLSQIRTFRQTAPSSLLPHSSNNFGSNETQLTSLSVHSAAGLIAVGSSLSSIKLFHVDPTGSLLHSQFKSYEGFLSSRIGIPLGLCFDPFRLVLFALCSDGKLNMIKPKSK